ncbi:type VI secretion system baseplate subunit TssG [Salmonella enterica]|nr:type VI secretion system baseplate subunit TssG [Salmonella enterica]EGW2853025.1 type VI secretion system baseplate subunit TssG [Salmonella enterica]
MALRKLFSSHLFFQQVRMMLRFLQTDRSKSSISELQDKLYFVSPLSMDAPEGEVGSVEKLSDGRWQVEVFSGGLTGATGALPAAYTEWLIKRYYRYGDLAAKGFLDIFNHRLHMLRFLAWLKYHFYAQHEICKTLPLGHAIRGLAGMNPATESTSPFASAGLMAHPVRSMLHMEKLLEKQFTCEVEIIPFTGGWCVADRSLCCCLGNFPEQTLGQSPMLGLIYRDVASTFIVRIGPMTVNQASDFLPGGSLYDEIWQSVREFVGIGLEFGIELKIQNSHHHDTSITSGRLGFGCCLGVAREGFHIVKVPAAKKRHYAC